MSSENGSARERLFEVRFRAAVQATRGVLWTNDAQGRMIGEQPGWEALTGQSFEDYQGYGWADSVHPDDAQPTIDAWNIAVERREIFVFEHRIRRSDGEWRLCAIRAIPVIDDTGAVSEWVGVHTDITEERAAQEKLRASEERLAAIFASANVGLSEVTLDGRFIRVNDELCRILARSEEDVLSRSVIDVTHPDDVKDSVDALQKVISTGEATAVDKRYIRADGSLIWANSRVTRLHDREGRAGNLLVATLDLTDRKATEEGLRASEELNRRILASSADCIKVLDLDARLEFMSEGAMCVMEVDDFGAVEGTCWPDFWQGEERSKALAAVQDARRGGTGRFQGFATTLKGTPRWWDVIVTAIYGADGRPERLLSVSRDITASREAEERLRELNESLEQRVGEAIADRDRTWNNARDLLLVVGNDGVFRAVNPAWSALLGWNSEELIGRSYLEFIHPDDHPSSESALAVASSTGLPTYENRYRHKDGSYRWISWVAAPEGDLVYASGRDVTEEKARRAELEKAQEALRQSQKMEAMGQLTGGVAHDFNNLLTPIVGSLDMLQRQGVGGEREQRLIAGAAQSAERAKTLVQRLLAFARRQPLQSVPVDIAKLVTGMGDLISSTTGPQIRVVVEAAPELPAAKADANQLEMALLNLSVNARDAMSEGGTLRISATAEEVIGRHFSGLSPGPYVRLSVADTGAGMDEATMARAIEPFFSTKGVGKGTGLGLSMAHGLATQLGGTLTIQSRAGIGTNVELWLPQTDVASSEKVDAHTDPGKSVARGTALLVDDEELVRSSTADMLTQLGYTVVEAHSAEHAISLFESGDGIDLVVTDHLMPGMNGTELIRLLRAEKPQLTVLLVSGYAGNNGIEPHLPRLSKPFRQDELRHALQACEAPPLSLMKDNAEIA